MTLYDISTQYQEFLSKVESGEIPEEAVSDTLEGLDGVFDEKADNIACVIKSLNAESQAIKEERDKLADRQKSKENTAQRLKDYLFTQMAFLGKTKLETARNVLSFRKSEAVVIVGDVPEKYLKVKTEPDKTAIKAALKAGADVPGAHIEQREGLVIK